MVYKRGSLKGQLTTAEIRKLVSAHNKLSKITIPPKSTRDAIMSIIVKAGFRVNHGDQKLEQVRATKKDISLEKAKEITKRLPKTEEQKQKSTAQKEQKKAEKDKELKLAKKEGVKEFQAKKAEAQKKKPVPKPPAVKKKTSTMGTQTGEKVSKYQIFLKLLKQLKNRFVLLSREDKEKKYTIEGEIRRPFKEQIGDEISRYSDNTEEQFNDKPVKSQDILLSLMNKTLELIQKQPTAPAPNKIKKLSGQGEAVKKPQKTKEEPQKTKEESKKILKKAFPNKKINSLKAFPGMFHFNFSLGFREKRNIEMKDISEKIKEVKSKIPKDILDRLVISFYSGYSDNKSQLRYNFGNDKLIETNRSKK